PLRSCLHILLSRSLFFFTATPPTEIYTLSLHDALPISRRFWRFASGCGRCRRSFSRRCAFLLPARHSLAGRSCAASVRRTRASGDRKSTRLNSSHVAISYAVFCLKKKNKQ